MVDRNCTNDVFRGNLRDDCGEALITEEQLQTLDHADLLLIAIAARRFIASEPKSMDVALVEYKILRNIFGVEQESEE